MASGRQVAEENVAKFMAWAASKTDDEFRSLAARGALSRSDIAAECGFARSALAQNPRIRAALLDLESKLRERGVLPKAAAESSEGCAEAPTPFALGSSAFRDAERLRRLEQENAALRAELAEVKKALSRYAVIQEVLAETGRLPL
jgi:hypothetical protein